MEKKLSLQILQNRFLFFIIVTAIGLLSATTVVLFGVPYFFTAGTHAIIFIVSTVVFTAGARLLLKRVLIPRLQVFSPAGQAGLVLLSVVVGAILFLSSPLDVPDNVLIYVIFGDAIASWLSPVSAILALTVVNTILLLTVLLVGVGTEEPLWPRFWVVTIFLVIYLLAGLTIYDDYGLSSDEAVQRLHGKVAANHILSYLPDNPLSDKWSYLSSLDDYRWSAYGVAFQMPFVMFELINNVHKSPDIWLLRHYFTFLFFAGSVVFFYRLAQKVYGHWLYGLAGMLLLVLTPRIFAHSFYNPKDPVFLAAFIVSLYAGVSYWRDIDKIRWSVLFGAAIAYATNMRVIALGLLCLVAGVVVLKMITCRRQIDLKQSLLSFLIMCLTFILVYFVITPAAWGDPVEHISNTIELFSRYTWGGSIHYMGTLTSGQEVPWHYIPVWMLITLPISVLMLFVVGLAGIFYSVWRAKMDIIYIHRQEPLVFLLLFLTPVLLAIVMESTLYQGWRHFMFIYAPFLLIALRGIQVLVSLWQLIRPDRRWLQGLLMLLAGSVLVYQMHILHWMIINHPYQSVYFNPIVNVFGGRENFERDYYRTSSRQAMEFLLQFDDSERIHIAGVNIQIKGRHRILPGEAQRRLVITDEITDDTDYLINLHWNPARSFQQYPVIYEIVVDGLPIVTIHDVRSATAESD